MGDINEEIREALKLRWAVVDYSDVSNRLDVPDFEMIENDIWESMHPFDIDPTMDSLYTIFEYWSMGSPEYPVSAEMIHEEMPYFSVSLIENAFERWNLTHWDSIEKREEGYVPQYSNISILDVGCFMGEYIMKLVRPDNKVVGIDIASELVEAANFRKEHFLEDKLRDNIKFVCRDFEDTIDKPVGKFDLIFINFPYPNSNMAHEPNKYISISSHQLKPSGELRLVTEVDDVFYRYKMSSPDGLKMIRAYETRDCSVDTLLSRSLQEKKPGRPFYEIIWRKGTK